MSEITKKEEYIEIARMMKFVRLVQLKRKNEILPVAMAKWNKGEVTATKLLNNIRKPTEIVNKSKNIIKVRGYKNE